MAAPFSIHFDRHGTIGRICISILVQVESLADDPFVQQPTHRSRGHRTDIRVVPWPVRTFARYRVVRFRRYGCDVLAAGLELDVQLPRDSVEEAVAAAARFVQSATVLRDQSIEFRRRQA